MTDYGLDDFHFADSAIRFVNESDIPAIVNLFRLNYGDDYLSPDVYDGDWIKRCIYDDGLIGLVLEENEEVVASGAVVLEFGDHDDQIGELARLVVHPERTGRGLGRRLIKSLFDARRPTTILVLRFYNLGREPKLNKWRGHWPASTPS